MLGAMPFLCKKNGYANVSLALSGAGAAGRCRGRSGEQRNSAAGGHTQTARRLHADATADLRTVTLCGLPCHHAHHAVPPCTTPSQRMPTYTSPSLRQATGCRSTGSCRPRQGWLQRGASLKGCFPHLPLHIPASSDPDSHGPTEVRVAGLLWAHSLTTASASARKTAL